VKEGKKIKHNKQNDEGGKKIRGRECVLEGHKLTWGSGGKKRLQRNRRKGGIYKGTYKGRRERGVDSYSWVGLRGKVRAIGKGERDPSHLIMRRQSRGSGERKKVDTIYIAKSWEL